MSIPELAEANTVSAPRDLHILRLADSTSDIPSTVRDALEASGWQITEQKNGFHRENVPANPDAILALDELWHPLLTRATPDQWNAVQALAGSDKQLLWATQGLHLGRVTNPEQALAGSRAWKTPALGARPLMWARPTLLRQVGLDVVLRPLVDGSQVQDVRGHRIRRA
jgi:hypothetical protein